MQTDLRDFLNGLGIPSNTSRRVDCPQCGGSRTLSVSSSLGKLLYNCYRASCGLRGAVGGTVSLQDVIDSVAEKKKETFTVPQYFVRDVLSHGVQETWKDVKENRHVFLVKDRRGVVVDACGRALTNGIKPKWKRYGNSRHPFICTNSNSNLCNIAVVVEDCYSACAVAATGLYSGIALMGTSLHSGYSEWAREFSGLILALDYDAARKGLDYGLVLSWTVPTKAIILKKDLKHYTSEQIIYQLKDATESLERECQNRLQ